MKNRKTISIVVPCFNEEENIVEMYTVLKRLQSQEQAYEFEFVFIDNGSTDSTASIISRFVQKDPRVVGVWLARNFGHEASTQAGLAYTRGDAIILIACDMQEPPELIPRFIRYWEKGYDIVIGTYKNADDNIVITILRKLFYQLMKLTSSIEVPVNNTGFGLVSKQVLESIQLLPEKYRFFRGLRSWVGFKTKNITYVKQARMHGKSSYSFYSYFRVAERSLVTFSSLPLTIFMDLTLLFGIAGIVYSVYTSVRTGNDGMIVILSWMASIILVALSVLGKYLQVIFEETKNRPMYIVKKVAGLHKTV